MTRVAGTRLVLHVRILVTINTCSTTQSVQFKRKLSSCFDLSDSFLVRPLTKTTFEHHLTQNLESQVYYKTKNSVVITRYVLKPQVLAARELMKSGGN